MLDFTSELEQAPILLFGLVHNVKVVMNGQKALEIAISITALFSQLQFTDMVTLRHQRK